MFEERKVEMDEAISSLQKLRDELDAEREKDEGSLSDVAGGDGRQMCAMLKPRRLLKGHYGKVYAMHWAGDSKHLVSASQDGKLIVWEAFTASKKEAISLRSSWVMTCAFETTENRVVACGGLDNLCSVYNVNYDPKATVELSSHDGYLSCCRFIDKKTLLTSSGDSTCIVWDIATKHPLQQFRDHTGDVMSVSICPNNPQLFVSGSCDTTAKLWDRRERRPCIFTFVGHESDINAVKFHPSARAFGTGSDDATCKIFDLRCFREVETYQDEGIVCGITSVDFSKSGRLLLAGYDDYSCKGWDSTTGQIRYSLLKHSNRVSCVGVSPSGEALCTGSWDNNLLVWA